jgi:VCBS repeat protein
MYDAKEMPASRVRRAVLALAVSAAWSLARPAEVRADSPPPNLYVDAGWQGPIDLEWRQLPEVLKAIATDIDRDGDLDVVATTVDQPVVIWINDGTGHLTRQRPRSVPLAMEDTRDTALPDEGRELPLSTPASSQTPVLPISEARAPPLPVSCRVQLRPSAAFSADVRSLRDPRGPPLL